MELEMTAERKKRVIQAIAETSRYIEKEEKYSEDLRKHDYLNSLYVHLEKLNGMLLQKVIEV